MSPPKDPVKLIAYIKKQRESHLGAKNHNYKGKIKILCPVCGIRFEDTPKHAEDRVCCSNDCLLKYRSEKYSGEGNPFFGKTHSLKVRTGLREIHIGTTHSESTKHKMSVKKKGIPHTKEHSENIGKALAGREITWTDKISAAHQGLSLEEWGGFITPLYQKIRASPEYDTWRRAVFERDNYCDWFSGIKSTGNLNAHHIVPFAVILEQNNIKTFEEALNCAALWDVANGVTMIDTVHTAYHQMW